MKKIHILFFLLTTGFIIKANPVVASSTMITEFYFDESDDWQLELDYSTNLNGLPYDSILLYSTTDTIKLPTYETGLVVISQDSLNTDFLINRYADTLKIVSYLDGEDIEDILVFGDIASGASINPPKQGQSISRYNDGLFVIDSSPTIGHPNDTLGIWGIVKGIVYDKYSKPVKDTKLSFYYNYDTPLDSYFKTSEYGEYSTRVYSGPASFSSIFNTLGQLPATISISDISYVMEPDSVIELDIYLLDDLSGTDYINSPNTPISISPNPISRTEQFKIDSDLPITTSSIAVEIIDLNGKVVKKKKITHNSSTISAPSQCGIYIVRTMLGTKVISSNKITVVE